MVRQNPRSNRIWVCHDWHRHRRVVTWRDWEDISLSPTQIVFLPLKLQSMEDSDKFYFFLIFFLLTLVALFLLKKHRACSSHIYCLFPLCPTPLVFFLYCWYTVKANHHIIAESGNVGLMVSSWIGKLRGTSRSNKCLWTFFIGVFNCYEVFHESVELLWSSPFLF